MATKIASFIVPAWQGKLHALPRALGLNCNPLLLPCTWHILGAKMDAKKHVTDPPAECNSWTCMLEYWSQPDDVMNAWTRDRESDFIAGFTHTLSWATAVSLQGEVHQALLKAPLLTTEWNGKSLKLNSLTHSVSITAGSPSLLKLGDKQRHHRCCREPLPRRVKPMEEKREADGEKRWERNVRCKREDERLQHFFFFLFGLFSVDSWRMTYDQF